MLRNNSGRCSLFSTIKKPFYFYESRKLRMCSKNTSVSGTQSWQIRTKVFQAVCVSVMCHDDPRKTDYAFRGLRTKVIVRSHAARNTSDCSFYFWKTQLCVVCMYTACVEVIGMSFSITLYLTFWGRGSHWLYSLLVSKPPGSTHFDH